jgi:ABC-type phosphate transport system auxiliary subunit
MISEKRVFDGSIDAVAMNKRLKQLRGERDMMSAAAKEANAETAALHKKMAQLEKALARSRTENERLAEELEDSRHTDDDTDMDSDYGEDDMEVDEEADAAVDHRKAVQERAKTLAPALRLC